MRYLREKLKSQNGAALLVILAVSAILLPLIQGAWRESQIEHQFKRYRMNRLQSQYNAQAGISLSLLRLYVFKGLENSMPAQWESIARPLVDRIWSWPFAWPLRPSEEMREGEKQELKSLTSQSLAKGSFSASVSPEDGRLNINNLSSPLAGLRELTYETLLNLLLKAVEEREDLREKYNQNDLEGILNNLSDWSDEDSVSAGGGREDLLEEGKEPLNRSFASIEEIKKTAQMSQEIFELLSPHITVYGPPSLNINYASEEILRALGLPEALAEEILLRIQANSQLYKPFSGQKEFCAFLDELNFPFCDSLKERWGSLDMLSFGWPVAFRLKSRGEYRRQASHLTALLYDLSSSALSYQKSLYLERKRQREENTPLEEPEPENQKPQPLKIDYSSYKSLTIMYVKEAY